jgi:hypothetical protein
MCGRRRAVRSTALATVCALLAACGAARQAIDEEGSPSLSFSDAQAALASGRSFKGSMAKRGSLRRKCSHSAVGCDEEVRLGLLDLAGSLDNNAANVVSVVASRISGVPRKRYSGLTPRVPCKYGQALHSKVKEGLAGDNFKLDTIEFLPLAPGLSANGIRQIHLKEGFSLC